MGGYQQSFRGSTQYSFRSSTRHGSKRGSLRGSIHRNQGKGSLYNPTRVTGGSVYNQKGSFYGQQRTPQTSFYGQARTPGSSVYNGGRYKGSFRGSFRVPKGNENPPGLEKPPGLAHAGELKPVVETNMVGDALNGMYVCMVLALVLPSSVVFLAHPILHLSFFASHPSPSPPPLSPHISLSLPLSPPLHLSCSHLSLSPPFPTSGHWPVLPDLSQ